jgi:hypothetical protein
MTAIRKHGVVTEDHKLRLDVDIPKEVPAGEVELTLLVSPVHAPDKHKAVDCLREIAARGALRAGPDPAEWQRDLRQDRPLPGRT